MAKEKVFEALEPIKEVAKQNLIKNGTLLPVIFAFCEEGNYILPLKIPESQLEKDELSQQIKEWLKGMRAHGYIVVFEAFYLMIEKGKRNKIERKPLPSLSPNKKEAIFIIARNRLHSKSLIIPFRREEEKIIFEKERIIDSREGYHLEGRFANFLPSLEF